MVSFADALNLISTKVQTHRRMNERVSIDASLGRISAHDVLSPEQFPARATSAMDGFAVDSELTGCASPHTPFSFSVRGEVAAGDEPPVDSDAGVWEIMTGAAMPADCDACIRLEDVQIKKDGGVYEITIKSSISANTNVRQPGEDFKTGDVILRAGESVRSEDILCLATLGIESIDVFCKPRVAIIATGKELAAATEPLRHLAQVRNSTTPFLLAALRERGADPVFLGTVADDAASFNALFDKADGGDFDLVVTTGALSVGRHDFIAHALLERGLDIAFQKVSIRPGKPLLFGETKNKTFLIGLPGNPVASLIGLRFFVDAFLRSWLGQNLERPLRVSLNDEILRKPLGMTSFFRATLSSEGATSHPQQKASLLKPLLTTDVWIELAAESTQAQKGDTISAWPFLSSLNRR